MKNNFKDWSNYLKLLGTNNRTDLVIITFLTLFALIIRIGAIASIHGYSMCTTLRVPSYTFCSDDALYMTMARYMINGDFAKLLHPIWPPLFPILSGLVFLIVHNWAASPRIVSLLAGSLVVMPLYYVCINYFSRSVAVVVCVILALFSPLVFASIVPLSDMLMLFNLWTSIGFLLLAFKKRKLLFAFLSGLFFGLTALTRVEGIIAFASFLLFFAVLLLFKKMRTIQILKLFVCILIGFFIIYTPYQLAMYSKFHQSTSLGKASALFNFRSHADLTQNGTSTFGQDADSIETVNLHSEIYTGFWEILSKRHEAMIDDTITRLHLEFNKVSSYLNSLELLLILLGFIFFYKASRKNKEMLFLYIFFPFTLLGTTFFEPSFEERYIYWLLPFIPLLLGLGIVNLVKAIAQYLTLRSNAIIAVYILLLLFLFNGQLIDSIQSIRNLTSINQKLFITPEDAWLMQHAPRERVMMHHEGYGFYSESFIIYTPNVDTISELVKYAHLWKVSYMIAEYGEVPDHLKYLLDDPKDYPGLKVIKGKNMLIYKIQ